jgi:hypothetical protein
VIAARDTPGSDTVCQLPGGIQVIWEAHPALHAQHDASLHFTVKDPTGQPAALEPYMGMMSHAAILRGDGRVFAHLHPAGNYSMAAQMYFDTKMASEGGPTNYSEMVCGPGGTAIGTSSVITLPYEFPSPGNYRVWVQVKTGGEVKTAAFDTTVL